MKRTIKELSNQNGRVYVYFANAELGKEFMKQAEKEGFTFGDGVKPTEREASVIMAVNRDDTINFVGHVGMMAFGSGIKAIGNEPLIRVDFEKYKNGADDFFI